MESKWDKPVGLVTEKLLSHVPGFSDHSRPQGSSGSLFQLEKQRPGESAAKTIYSRPVGSGLSLASIPPAQTLGVPHS